MTMTNEMPTSGRFTAVWLFNGKICSSMLMIDEETSQLMEYSQDAEDYVSSRENERFYRTPYSWIEKMTFILDL